MTPKERKEFAEVFHRTIEKARVVKLIGSHTTSLVALGFFLGQGLSVDQARELAREVAQ